MRKISFPKMQETTPGFWESYIMVDGQCVGSLYWKDGVSTTWGANPGAESFFGHGTICGFRRVVDARKRARELFKEIKTA